MMDQHNRVGQQFGNYRLERLLGRGSFAEVYLGQHMRLQRPAAIKILHTVLSEQEIDDFQREAQIIAALDHPNIVRVFDFDVQQGIPFLAIDYLPHGTLRQRHKRGTRLDLPTVVSYVRQIAAALQYAHDLHLIHRDIKPANMLVGRHGDVVLSDFGMAVIAHGSSSMEGQDLAGTAAYIAPEQIRMQAREASDQYALGVVVYEWFSGKLPFEGVQSEVLVQHLMTPPAPLRQQVPHLPANVEQVVLTALAKDFHQRFPTVQAFAVALEQASQIAGTVKVPDISSIPPSSSPHEFSTVLFVPSTPTSVVQDQSTMNLHVPTAVAQVAPPTLTLRVVSKQKHTRRNVLIGLGVLGLGAAGAGITWEYRSPPPFDPYIYRGHSDYVYAVVWSPDGQHLASGSADNTVQVWDAVNGNNEFTYHKHTNLVTSVAWSPDGKRLVSGSYDGTVQVWNATDGSYVYTSNQYTAGVNGVAWSPNGQRIAAATRSGTVQIWDAIDGNHAYIYHGHTNGVNAVVWSPDGQRIASGGLDTTVQIMHATDGNDVYTYRGHVGDIYTLAWSLTGQSIASGSGDHTVQVWSAIDGSYMYTYRGHTSAVYAVAWSPDGQRLASASDDSTVQVWNVTDGSHVYTYHGHSSAVTSVAWSPDGQRLASGSYDTTVHVWEPQ